MSENKNSTLLNRVIDGISAVFIPIVNLLSAAGILKGVLLVLVTFGAVSQESGSYAVLNAMGDSLFYFLPVILADSCAKCFNANRYTAMVVAGVLLYPDLVLLMSENPTVSFFGLPLKSVTYSSTVIPIICAVLLLSKIEAFLEKRLPEVIKGFSLPIISVVVVSLAALLVFGPVGAVVGEGLAAGYNYLYGLSPLIAGLILGGSIQFMVIVGVHWSFVLIAMNNIALTGEDTILAIIAPAIFAQAGAGLAVILKAKGDRGAVKSFRSTSVTGIVSAVLGVTEPIMYGVNLPRKKPMAAVCMGGAIGGAMVGLCGARARAFAFPSLASLPVFFGDGFVMLLIACAVAFTSAFLASLFLKYDVDFK